MSFSLERLKNLKVSILGSGSTYDNTQSQSAQNELSVGIKISELSTVEDVLSDDIFVISRKEDGSTYDSSKNITYKNLYSDIRENLLSDNGFLNGMYSYLSSRFLHDNNFIKELKNIIIGQTGTLIFYSNYGNEPEKTVPVTYKMDESFKLSSIEELGMSRPGYEFSCWVDQETLSTYKENDTVKFSDPNTQFNGVWTISSGTITYNSAYPEDSETVYI